MTIPRNTLAASAGETSASRPPRRWTQIPFHPRNLPRRVVAGLLVAVTALLIFSAVTPWWQAQLIFNDRGNSSLVQLGPGAAFQCSATGLPNDSACAGASSHLNGAFAALYEALGIGLVVMAVVAALAAAMAILGNHGFTVGRRGLTLLILLAFLLTAVPALAIGGTVAAGPGSQAASVCSAASPAVHCTEFFGTFWNTGSPPVLPDTVVALTWDGGPAFYATSIATVLGAVASAVLWRTRPEPYTVGEVDRWSLRHRPYPLRPGAVSTEDPSGDRK